MRYLVGACCLALVAAGCGSGGKSSATTKPTTTNVTTTATVTVSGRYRYSPKIIRSFMRSCTQGNAAKESYCACVLDKLSNGVSTRDFARIARTGKAVPRVATAIRRATVSCKGTS